MTGSSAQGITTVPHSVSALVTDHDGDVLGLRRDR